MFYSQNQINYLQGFYRVLVDVRVLTPPHLDHWHSPLTQHVHTHAVCCRTTRDERQLAHKGMHSHTLSAHSHTLSAHILSVVSHAVHILPAVYEYTAGRV